MERPNDAMSLPRVSPDEAGLRRRWAEATMSAWYGETASDRREAQERADALWDLIVARTPMAEV